MSFGHTCVCKLQKILQKKTTYVTIDVQILWFLATCSSDWASFRASFRHRSINLHTQLLLLCQTITEPSLCSGILSVRFLGSALWQTKKKQKKTWAVCMREAFYWGMILGWCPHRFTCFLNPYEPTDPVHIKNTLLKSGGASCPTMKDSV